MNAYAVILTADQLMTPETEFRRALKKVGIFQWPGILI